MQVKKNVRFKEGTYIRVRNVGTLNNYRHKSFIALEESKYLSLPCT